MNSPEWLKTAVSGAVIGAGALAIIGFSWGGWVTGATAEKMAAEQARLEVVAALVPICIVLSSNDPEGVATRARLKNASSYRQRNDMLMQAGWATMPGTTEPNRYVANACMEQLAAEF